MTAKLEDCSISIKEFIENPNITQMMINDILFSKTTTGRHRVETIHLHTMNQRNWTTFIGGIYKGEHNPYIICWAKGLTVLHFDDLEATITYVLLHNHEQRL